MRGKRLWTLLSSALLGSLILASALTGCAPTAQPGTPPQPATPPAPAGQPAPTVPARFSALTFLDAKTGWVAGRGPEPDPADPLLVGTRDGGRTWTHLAVPGDYVLQLKFVDPDHGWAVSGKDPIQTSYNWSNLAVFATADGGKTWTRQWQAPWPKNLMENLRLWQRISIRFFDLSHGFIMAGGQLLVTSDGGAAWQAVRFPVKDFTPVDGSFIDEKTGWVSGQTPESAGNPPHRRAMVLATSDGGKTWRQSFEPPSNTPYIDYYSSVAFPDRENGWFYFMGDDLAGYLYRTQDGGKTWKPVETPPEAFGRRAVGSPVFLNSRVAWWPVSGGASPFPGAIALTANGGTTWSRANTREDWSIGALSVVSDQDAWVITDRPNEQGQNLLLHTVDGGATWQEVLPAATGRSGPAAGENATTR